MYNCCDDTVHFQRRYCSTSPAKGVQLERYIQLAYVQEGQGVAIAMEIYEKIRYYHEHTDYSQRKVAQMLGVSRNTVKKYWKGQSVPWERKPGSGRKNDVITDEVRKFIISCLEADNTAPKKQQHTARRIYERLVPLSIKN